MSAEQRCRPRFKGIENFLRRVAFNLGNTPSQTEVKIISCIPIDVTDLQHKIIQLEKDLEERGGQSGGKAAGVHTALGAPRLAPAPRPSCNLSYCECYSKPKKQPSRDLSCYECSNKQLSRNLSNCECSFKPNKQTVGFATPTLELKGQPSAPVAENALATNQFQPNVRDSEEGERGGLFRRVKKIAKKKDKCNTQLVYYAQTTSKSPFNVHNTAEMSKNAPKDLVSRSYLQEMVRKQYKPDKMVVEMSDTSQFSSPVCRDIEHSTDSPCAYESDMCSCCRGRFQNVDLPRHTHNVFETNPTHTNDYSANSMYYDTSLYDMVPVKERPTKQKNDDDCPMKKEHKINVKCRNYPEKVRVKSRFQPYIVNYHTAPARINHKLARRKIQAKTYTKNVKKIASKRKLYLPMSTETSNSCSVNCGEFYSRAFNRRPVIQRIIRPSVKAVLQKNAECFTISLNNTECQTVSTKSVQLEPNLPDENKTEMTLNQIKSILQSVLTEVKTSSQMKTVPENKPKKDAVVQKGPSQSDIQACSSLLNSYSYSAPYNVNPYAVSCSRQINSTQPLSYPAAQYSPLKCLQNYPLFIQTTGRQCACCYRNMPNMANSAHTKHAITTATNTESIQEHRNKETEKLIKEIYKSLAINMDFPAKDTSNSEYEDLKSSDNSKRRFEFKFEPTRSPKVDAVVECVSKRAQETSTKPIYTNTTFESNIISNAASTRTPLASKTTTDNRTRAERMEGYLESQMRQLTYSERARGSEYERGSERARGSDYGRGSERDRRSQRVRRRRVPLVVELPNATTTVSDADTCSSDEDSDGTIVPAEEPKKKGRVSIFSKVAKLFKGKPKKEKESNSESELDSQASDSDDYQTIKSQESEKRPKHVTYEDRRRTKVKPHSKVSYSRYYMHRDHKNDKRQSPYMEQEYRRYWDEKIMFHGGGNTNKYSSERPFSNQTVQQQKTYPVYWQNYEARNTYVEPRNNIVNPGQEVAVGQSNVENMMQPKQRPVKVSVSANKGLAWLRKNKPGIHCGEQWKKMILEG